MKPTIMNLVRSLIGKRAQANHPITCLNPEPYFVIEDVKIDDGKVFCKGANTCWFGENMLAVFDA